MKATFYGSPLVVCCFLVIDIHDIDLFHLAPFHALLVEVADTVGGQIGHLNTNQVVIVQL